MIISNCHLTDNFGNCKHGLYNCLVVEINDLPSLKIRFFKLVKNSNNNHSLTLDNFTLRYHAIFLYFDYSSMSSCICDCGDPIAFVTR